LALEGAKDFDTNQELRAARDNDKDHLFPRSKKHGFGSHKDVESILNITWMSKATNRRIKRYRNPSEYLKWFIANRYNNEENEFTKNLETHLVSKTAYESMLRNDFESFLNKREELIISKIKELLGIEEPSLGTLITPEDPFKNRILYERTISRCEEYLYWIDKYFSKKGLIFLADSIDPSNTKKIKILTSTSKATKKLRNYFKDFRRSMKNKGVTCELRIIIDRELESSIHDRWILSKNKNFNIPSPDIIARGQYSEIKETRNKPPFEKWWKRAADIITDWGKIEISIKQKRALT